MESFWVFKVILKNFLNFFFAYDLLEDRGTDDFVNISFWFFICICLDWIHQLGKNRHVFDLWWCYFFYRVDSSTKKLW